ncbi:LacI family DNA-binding transcriptional regulator [Metabacillus sp. KIGAM252]|uniref:LacI family DNA-binding transcriptional regulator n=1 Tax=Metabacillus flavus TaxID=2823519 RepID=A0ABS5LBC8_9BACI|nr:LacI family DNA-binding transcriptional regulator [Metabacillus flavus]MBS2968015.1 LacI family DNA-binding transcriptional regulator [Metabacillus flavus]
MKRVTMADVATAAGISKSTVSQFLNGRFEYMGQETKDRIKKAIDELGYHPNYIARSLKQKRTSLIGIIAANIVHTVSTEMSRAIEDYFQEKDIQVIFCNSYEDENKEKKYIESMRARQVDGLVIFPTGKNPELYKKLESEKYPVVFVDRKLDGIDVNTVVVDNRDAMDQAVGHLLKEGHEKLAILTPPPTIFPRRERVAGFIEALEKRGEPVNEHFMRSVEISEMVSVLEEMFANGKGPTALIAGNDLTYFEVMKFARKNEIRIGRNLALVVFDNIEMAAISEPALTVIDQPAYEMGMKAADLLFEQISGKSDKTGLFVFQTELKIRESSTTIGG